MRAAELGQWIRSCYGDANRLASTSANGSAPLVLELPEAATTFDRVVIQEDLAAGQRVRRYKVEYRAASGQPWLNFAIGQAIGHKRIDLAPTAVKLGKGAALRLVIVGAVAPPVISNFAAFAPCARK